MAKGIHDFLEMEDIIVEPLLRGEPLIFSREPHGSPRDLKFLVASSFQEKYRVEFPLTIYKVTLGQECSGKPPLARTHHWVTKLL